MIIHEFDLDVVPGGRIPVIKLNQYDDDFTLRMNLYARTGDLTISSGSTVEIRGTKTDGNGYSEDCTISGNVVTVTGDQQMTASAGKNIFEVVVKKSGKELNTANFVLDVERAALDKDTLVSGSKIRELVNVIDRTDEIIAAAELADDARDDIAALTARSETAATNAESSELAAEEAAQAAVLAMQTMDATIQQRTDQAIDEIDEAYEENMAAINTKAQQILDIKTNAESTAGQALAAAANAENHMASLDSKMRSVEAQLDDVSIDPDDLGLYQDPDTNYVYPTYKNIVSENGIPLSASGGGGGGGDTIAAVLTVTNTTGWLSKTIASGSDCNLTFSWSSIEDNSATGDGSMRIMVGDVVKATRQISQGNVTVNVKDYLTAGSNKVKIRISDIYDQGRTITFNITVMVLTISSTFDASEVFDGAFTFPYTPTTTGSIDKTVYFIVDGTQVATATTAVSGRQMIQEIPAQSHGGHSLRVYFEVTINNETVRSNELYYEFITVQPLNTGIIIVSSFNTTSVNQYDTISIPFRVYNPMANTTSVDLYVGTTKVSTQTVDRTEQSYTIRANTAGSLAFKVQASTVSKTFNLTVVESSIDVSAETTALALYLNAQGRSNNEATKATWTSGNVSATLSGFTWVQDGWQTDTDGINVLRLTDAARVTIPYKIFENDFKSSGKTIEIEFATREVSDYTATILSCVSGGVGLTITPQQVTFAGAQTSLNTLYKDNEHIRLSIVVEKQNANRLILIYINGIMSRAIQYAAGERFSQLSPVNISIGSSDCGIDIYNIRVYDNDLTREQVLTNWIADTQIGSLMVERYTHNNVYNASMQITTADLPSDLPYMIIEAAELPQYKGDKKTVSGTYVDPVFASKSFTFSGCQINVQGTSSSVYFRKNYDLQFKEGFTMTATGSTAESYALRTGSIPFNRFVLKADVASSESCNNTGLTMFYNDLCPYKTPEMVANDKVRWGIEGIPIVLFWYDTATQTTQFMGKYNFNLPKRAPAPYGFSGNMESWEFERNNSDNVKFKDNDFTTMSWDEVEGVYYPEWYNDFEARFPSDEWRDISQLNEFLTWVKSTNRDAATSNNLSESVTYRVASTATVDAYSSDSSYTVVDETVDGTATGYKLITFTKDTPAYRLTKFRAEFADYAMVESATFYYIFTEFFLMIDSRAKNMFIGFNGANVTGSGRQMTRKVTFQPYDMDTAIGTNNSGILMFGYYHEDTDTVSAIISGEGSSGSNANVFNAQDSVLWQNFRDSFRSEIVSMYRTLRASGSFSYAIVKALYENHQSKWPEAIFNEDAYVKYLYPLVEAVTYDEETETYVRTDRYLTMLQGSKAEQRKWWLYNRFRYMDSKFSTGDAAANTLDIRLFNSGTLTITPAIDMYVGVAFGLGSTPELKRTTANVSKSFTYTASSAQEMETSIYSGDMITSVGDLSGFYPNEINFAKARRLKTLKIGSNASGYSNANLTTLNVTNSPLLESIDVRNCPNLAITVNLENSPRLKTAYFDGTAVTGVDLADGGSIETLHLPATITSLTLLNLSKLEDLTVASYEHVTRLMVANIDNTILDIVTVLETIPANSQVNIQGLNLTMSSKSDLDDFIDLLDTMKGVTRERGSNGEWLYHDHAKAQVSGTIVIDSLTGAELAAYNARYPDLVHPTHTTSYLTFKTWDGQAITNGVITCQDGTPTTSLPAIPSRTSTAQYSYTGIGWNLEQDQYVADATAITDVYEDRTVYAAYSRTVRTYTVTWKNGTTTLETDTNVPWGTIPEYNGTTPTSEQGDFQGWNPPVSAITGDTTYSADFSIAIREPDLKYLVYTTDDVNMTMTITGLNVSQILADNLQMITIPDTIQGYHVILA